MKAVQFDAVRSMPRVVEVLMPVCPPDGVLIEVRATGVCRSDWHAWQGHDPVALPHIPGHEFAGEVFAVGAEVRRWAPGDRVTVPFVCGCGRCDFCAAGEVQVCPDQRQPGFTDDGSFAEYVAVHAADVNLVRLPEDLDFVTAASLGCRFATAFRAVTVHGRVSAVDHVVVFGCGGVGLSAVMIAASRGARVVAVDPSAAARARALELGASAVLDPGSVKDVAAAVISATDGGAHVALECLGRAAVAVDAVRSLRRRGRLVQVGLLLGDQSTPALPMDRVIGWELEIYGSHGMAAHEYPRMLGEIASGRLRPQELVGRQIGLDEAGDALAAMSGAGAESAGGAGAGAGSGAASLAGSGSGTAGAAGPEAAGMTVIVL